MKILSDKKYDCLVIEIETLKEIRENDEMCIDMMADRINRLEEDKREAWFNDEWSAARYFYCAKASRHDRDEGIDAGRNGHPTIKPTSLMQYLVRLVTPNGWTVLDPFNWSGSTGKAVMYENKDRNKNYKYIWIELTEEYLPISKARIEYVTKQEQPPILFSDFAGYDEENFTD